MSLFNLIPTDERQQIEAAYAKTGECLARYQRCKDVLDSNANLNDGKQRVRNWLQALPETERELCRAVLNGITTAQRHYAAVKASGKPTKPNTVSTTNAPAMPTPAEREALRQALANRTGVKGNV